MDIVQFYIGAASSEDYLFVSYLGCSLKEERERVPGTELRVFDWNGNYLCEIALKEEVETMTYDAKTGYLYSINEVGEIVRYDLSSLLLLRNE